MRSAIPRFNNSIKLSVFQFFQGFSGRAGAAATNLCQRKAPLKHCPVTGKLGLGPPPQLTAASGFTVKPDDTVVADEAIIVTAVMFPTTAVDTENVALVLPAGIVTEAGTDATATSPLESEIATPPAGADVAAVAVPVEMFPLTTESGTKFRADNATVAGLTVMEAISYSVES